MIERAAARGEIPMPSDPALVVELVVAPTHFRLLLSREPVDDRFADALAELVAACAER
jgi:hypothetical protein